VVVTLAPDLLVAGTEVTEVVAMGERHRRAEGMGNPWGEDMHRQACPTVHVGTVTVLPLLRDHRTVAHATCSSSRRADGD
jgi:hypothetical protein